MDTFTHTRIVGSDLACSVAFQHDARYTYSTRDVLRRGSYTVILRGRDIQRSTASRTCCSRSIAFRPGFSPSLNGHELITLRGASDGGRDRVDDDDDGRYQPCARTTRRGRAATLRRHNTTRSRISTIPRCGRTDDPRVPNRRGVYCFDF